MLGAEKLCLILVFFAQHLVLLNDKLGFCLTVFVFVLVQKKKTVLAALRDYVLRPFLVSWNQLRVEQLRHLSYFRL